MNKVTLTITFKELFWDDVKDDERRERWEEWKRIAREEGKHDALEYWTDAPDCKGCIWKDKDWCEYRNLPCTYEPGFSDISGMMGMACEGTIREGH